MSRLRAPWIALGIVVLLLLPGSVVGSPRTQDGPLVITPVSPGNNETVTTAEPNITASFSDSVAPIEKSSVYVIIDHFNVTGIEGFYVTTTSVSYTPIAILKLKEGPHNITVGASDTGGHSAAITWAIVVNTSLAPNSAPLTGINVRTILLYIALGTAIAGALFAGYILFLRRTRKFTFRKYFATHPLQREYLSLYVPLVVAFFFALVILVYVYSTPGLPYLAPEYAIIATMFVALTTYAIDSRAEKRRIRQYERAFAQFLFEMADAMRGGIDPAKAVIELSTTHTNILRKHLRIAADGIRVGRPFEEVLRTMAQPMKSPLINRYAALIADASNVGGETSAVVHRAAKDMDDFIKIEVERGQALTMPVAVLYIAFGVLLAVLFSLLSIAPSLGNLNLSLLNSGSPLSGGGGASVSAVPKLDLNTLKERFFDLCLINALGTGIIIGAFTEGKAKYGLLHSLILIGATTVAFILFSP